MASKRLTDTMRQRAIWNVLNTTFNDRIEALRARETDLGDRVYRRFMGDHEAAMYSLPAGYFLERESTHIEIAKSDDRDATQRFRLAFSKSRRVPATFFDNWVQYTLKKDDPLVPLLLSLDRDKSELAKEKDALEQKITPVLNSVTTVPKLLEVWPEAKDYLPPEAFETNTAGVPAVLVSELNQAIATAKAA